MSTSLLFLVLASAGSIETSGRTSATPAAFQLQNQNQQWNLEFDGRGVQVTPKAGGWSWGLALKSYGWAGGGQRTVSGRAIVSPEPGKVSYAWTPNLSEWFINGDNGLEHGYTIAAPEAGASRGRLSLHLAVRGTLHPIVANDGQGVLFGASVTYTGLTVFDARGQKIPARFRKEAGGLRLDVEDANAQYPLTIDPLVQQAYIKASNTGAFDRFGASVGLDGDTMVVGAPEEDSNGSSQADESVSNAGAAYVFVRSGTTWTQQAYLKAATPGAGDKFGTQVAIVGDTVVITAPGDTSNAGAAYVFVRSGTAWTQQAYLKASNAGAGDQFGTSLALSGESFIVGAPYEQSAGSGVNSSTQNDNSASNAGAAYVFVRSGTTWTQQAYLKASNTNADDQFGLSVAIDSNTAVVGAPGEASKANTINGNQSDNTGPGVGAAYVFVRSGTTWTQQAYLKGSKLGLGAPFTTPNLVASFGRSVAVSGDTVAVGAPNEYFTNSSQGAGFVFVRTGTTWSEQLYTHAIDVAVPNNRSYLFFGTGAYISGDTVIFTGFYDAYGVTAAQTYVYSRVAKAWYPFRPLSLNPSGVALNGSTLALGIQMDANSATGVNPAGVNSSADHSGAVYVFPINTYLAAQPEDVNYTVTGPGCNGGSYKGPDLHYWAPGSTCAVAFSATQTLGFPPATYTFSQWENNSTSANRLVPVAALNRLVAMYSGGVSVFTSTNPFGTGTFTSIPASQFLTFPAGSNVQLKVTPQSGYKVGAFTSTLTGCNNSTTCIFQMPSSGFPSVTANMVQYFGILFTPSITLLPPNGGTVTPSSGTYYEGDVETFTATPAPGFAFSSWGGGYCAGTNPVCTLSFIRGFSDFSFGPPVARPITANFSAVSSNYTLTTTANPTAGGTVTGGGTYASGTNVNVTATANPGYQFTGWSGACTGTGPCVVNMNGAKTVTANFGTSQFALTTAANPVAGGTVTGGGTYNSGTNVTVTATANSGYQFASWSGACSGTGSCVVTMDSAKTVTANFTQLFTLTTAANPVAGGTVTGGGTYNSGTNVTVTATANSGYQFASWTGACSGTGSCVVTMDSAKTVTANFTQLFTLTTAANPVAGGTVSPATGLHTMGSVVNVSATANPGYRFAGFSGACTGTGACSVTMNSAQSVTANFVQTFDLTTVASPLAGGTLTPASGPFDIGSVVNVTATANPGYRFTGFSGACTGTGPCSVTMNSAQSVTANFVQTFQLTTSASPVAGGTVSPATASYDTGTIVTVTATANSGYRFSGWSGACTGTGACSVTVNAAKSVVANFVQQFVLTVNNSPSGAGTVTGSTLNCVTSCSATFDTGTVVTLTATPTSTYTFSGWTGACTGTGTCTVTLNAATTVTANYAAIGSAIVGATLSGKTGTIGGARVWNLTFTNSGTLAASNLSLNTFTLLQTAGTICSPVVSTTMPVALGNLAPAASVSTGVSINFTGCALTARFKLTAGYSANAGAVSNTLSLVNQTQ